jgi:CHAT domain-containing protein/tetratricopeptide (TPR) repeat protein
MLLQRNGTRRGLPVGMVVGALVSWLGVHALAAVPPDTRPTTAPATRPTITPQQAAANAEIIRLLPQATALRAQGRFAEEAALRARLVTLMRLSFGNRHLSYAVSLDNLAHAYVDMGDYVRAEPLYRLAIAIERTVPGDHRTADARSLNNLALLYDNMGDYARAEPLDKAALEIQRAAQGDRSRDYAGCLNNLASVYVHMGNPARAEPLYREATEVFRSSVGEGDPTYATSLDNLATLYDYMGQYARAEQLYLRAIEIRRLALGQQHPDYARGLNNLAGLYDHMGDPAIAELLYRQAAAIWRRSLGERHPDYALGLSNLAAACDDLGDDARAVPLARQALNIMKRQMDATAAVQSERQQMLSALVVGRDVDTLLTVSTAAPAGETYDAILPAKGLVSLRQQEMRAVGGGSVDPATAALRAELADASGQLSRRSRAVAATTRAAADAQVALDQLGDRVEHLQQELAARDAAYRQSRERLNRTAAEVVASLPADAVLVDVRQYAPLWTTAQKRAGQRRELHLAAFVVRHGQPVARVELGPTAPVDAAVDEWRKTFGAGVDAAGAGATLRRLVWQPLVDHAGPQLAGATTVLLSPDGPLCRFPLAALPGAKPGTYLIEDVAVGVIAVPAALPDLLAPSARPAAAPSLLLVGDVDYGATPASPATEPTVLASAEPMHRSAARDGGQLFAPLPQTQAEAATVREQFEDRFPDGKLVRLRRGQATVAAVRERMAQSRWVHIATHGFFADPAKPSAAGTPLGSASGQTRLAGDDRVAGYHPGLLSGIALAGANAPTADDDGILTALEVEELNLSGVDLAVLSACDTGLGKSAGGEGLLGLQRALQVAGAKTVIASLWPVDDGATRDLMIHFYRALWRPPGDPAGPTGKLAALRAAQLDLLRDGGHRGLASASDAQAAADTGRLPPRYWAAFVLSGDWR